MHTRRIGRTLAGRCPRLGGRELRPPSSAAEARRTSDVNLSLVAYSTPAGAFSKIIPAFQATPAGKDVSFKQSYGASGTQAAAVHNGLPADVVNLSLAPDVSVLSQAGLIGTNWNKDKFGGMVTDSIVVFVVRKGNPKNIKTWNDLIKPGIQVINAEPVHLGRRALERHGRLGRPDQAAQDARRRPTPTSRRSTRTSPCRTRARAPR